MCAKRKGVYMSVHTDYKESILKPYINFETERLHIRSLLVEDRDAFMALRKSNSQISVAYSAISDFEELEWQNELESSEDLYLSVFLKSTNRLVASASIQHYREEAVELGYDVSGDFRNRGYASELVKGLVSEIRRLRKDARIIIKIDKDNVASIRVAEKCGAVRKETADSFVNKLYESLSKDDREAMLACSEEDGSNELEELLDQSRDSVLIYEFLNN